MARLIVVFDVDLPPTEHDPHEVVDDLLTDDINTFIPGNTFFTRGRVIGTFVSAEWDT